MSIFFTKLGATGHPDLLQNKIRITMEDDSAFVASITSMNFHEIPPSWLRSTQINRGLKYYIHTNDNDHYKLATAFQIVKNDNDNTIVSYIPVNHPPRSADIRIDDRYYIAPEFGPVNVRIPGNFETKGHVFVALHNGPIYASVVRQCQPPATPGVTIVPARRN